MDTEHDETNLSSAGDGEPFSGTAGDHEDRACELSVDRESADRDTPSDPTVDLSSLTTGKPLTKTPESSPANHGTMKEWAHYYAQRGWSLFPLFEISHGQCSCGRSEGQGCTPGKHPRTGSGVKSATTSRAQIDSWWTDWPNANIGIATGAQSGLAVVDVDPKNGGVESFQTFQQDFPLPAALRVTTGSGGFHLYFAHPGSPVVNRVNLPGYPGIDLKGDGGYVVAPPSNHKSGKLYVLTGDANTPLGVLPQAIRRLKDQACPEKAERPQVVERLDGTGGSHGARSLNASSCWPRR